jgi:predicted hydrolase (HD superfamily)
MADLETLQTKSIADLNTDEAIELLRQIRLSRRVVKKTQSVATQKKKQSKKAMPKLTQDQAANLLKLLGD